MLGIQDAEHMEDATSGTPLITAIACAVGEQSTGGPALSGKLKITLDTGSLVHRIYDQGDIEEEYACSFNLNPDFRHLFEAKGFRLVGNGEDGEARVGELDNHRFFVGTLFLPQLASTECRPHPVITAYLQAVKNFRKTRQLAPFHATQFHVEVAGERSTKALGQVCKVPNRPLHRKIQGDLAERTVECDF